MPPSQSRDCTTRLRSISECGRLDQKIRGVRIITPEIVQSLSTYKGYTALKIRDRHARTAVADISYNLTSLAKTLDPIIPKLAQRDPFVRRSGFEIKGRVGGNAYGYFAFARLKAISSASGYFSIKEDVSNIVLSVHSPRANSDQFDVTF